MHGEQCYPRHACLRTHDGKTPTWANNPSAWVSRAGWRADEATPGWTHLMRGAGRCANHHSDGTLRIERHRRRASQITEGSHGKVACIEHVDVRMDAPMAQRRIERCTRHTCLRTRGGTFRMRPKQTRERVSTGQACGVQTRRAPTRRKTERGWVDACVKR